MAIITVSRQLGSGGRDIALAVTRAAQYSYVDKETIEAGIQKAGGPWASWEKELDEVCPTLWDRYDRSFAGLVALVEKAIAEAALANNVVIVGRGGNFLLRDVPHALHVRIVAPLDYRIEWVTSRMEIPKDNAQKLIQKIDHERACYLQAVYRRRWDSPDEYSVVFDAAVQSNDDIVQAILPLLQGADHRYSAEGQEKLRQMTRAAQVKAALLTEPTFFIPTLRVVHDGSAISVEGVIHNIKELRRIKEIVHEVAAGEPADLTKLHYRG